MKSKFTSKKSWREKVEKVSDYKVVGVPEKMQKRFGSGTMLIPKPLDMEALISRVRKGKLITKDELRRKLASDCKADVTCPITAGIFLRIISEASQEDFQNGKKKITPYWRVINNDGSLNEKIAGGAALQFKNLKQEGIPIEKRKKGKMYVKEFEKHLIEL